MKRLHLISLLAAGCALAADDGFVPLFNGRDLNGWVNANCAPETWSVRDGVIHCTGFPTGALRTEGQYENFILELEWRHLTSGGNSGVFLWGTAIAAPGVPFLRGIEVQVLDHGYAEQFEKQTGKKSDWFTTHGDVFPIHGATMKPFGKHNGMRSFPSEERSKRSPEWNQYRIVCTNGIIRLSVNDREVSGGEDCNYRKGYLALESEGAPVEFRSVRLKELPSSGVSADQTAPLDQGWRPLFNGLDLRGWKTNAVTTARWSVRGERLMLAAGEPNSAGDLWTASEIGNAELIVDCRLAKLTEGQSPVIPVVIWRGAELVLSGATPGAYQRFIITSRGRAVTVKHNEQETQRVTLPEDAPARGALGLRDAGRAMEFMNLYVRDL